MIYFRTCAYNAEKTLGRTIESILNQTVEDFKYYILENGSSDKTKEIIEEYAKRDARIVPYYNKVNKCYEENLEFWHLSQNLKDDDYFIILDADDYYEPTFLEELLNFMKENDLDTAACGSFFENEEGKLIGQVIQPNDILLRNENEYNENFSCAHWNMRQVWGKVYSGRVARNRFETSLPEWWPKAYGGDTINVMHSLKFSTGFGILAKGLHHYQISSKSVSYKWIEGREDADVTLERFAKEFLLEKVGFISEENQRFLSVVYINSLKDSLNVLLKAELSNSKVVEVIGKIFSDQATIDVLNFDYEDGFGAKEKKDLLIYQKVLLDWVCANGSGFDNKDGHNAYKFITSYGEIVESILSEDVVVSLLQEKPRIIQELLKGQVGSLLNDLINYMNERTSGGKVSLSDYAFAQNLTAYLGMEDLYIVYSKQCIAKLIDESKFEEAKRELVEWLELLPNDEELLVLFEKIEG